MSAKGDMPKTSHLTNAEKFVYFYMTVVASSVGITEYPSSGDDDMTRWYY
jgi:hypothetical protein